MTRSTGPIAGLLAGATAFAVLLPPAAATAASAPTEAAGSWLAGQLVDGDHLASEVGGQTYVNYGPTADVALGLLATGTAPATLEDVLAFLTDPASVDGYTGSGDEAYAGAVAKLGLTTTLAGLDPYAIGGTDLVATLEGLEADTGRYRDQSAYGDFSNILGQSFGLLFLEAAPGVDPSDAAVQFLADAQCDDGGFPQDFGTPVCESSIDATGMALQALVAVDATPQVRADAAAYLSAERDADGAWGDPANVNTTAYAGMGLLAQGRSVATTRAFLTDTQNDDGGLPISPGGDSDPIATAQALPLLAGTTLLATPPTTVGRVAGDDRQLTAIEASRADFADGAAATVVLTRDDLFADALAGTPLAVAQDGPLLTTTPDGLADDVLAEIQRVLPEGSEVLVLGGPDALPPRSTTR